MGAGRQLLTRLRPLALVYALFLGTLVFAGGELLNTDTPGPWFEWVEAAVLGLGLLTLVVSLRAARVRFREGVVGPARAWLVASGLSLLVALAATLALTTSLQVEPTLTGADVRLTRPVLAGLPLPPHATLVNEHPGLAGSESIVADYRVPDLTSVASFYRNTLPRAGWHSEASSSDALLRYRKGDFILIVVVDPSGGSHEYTVTVDRSPAPALGTVSPS